MKKMMRIAALSCAPLLLAACVQEGEDDANGDTDVSEDNETYDGIAEDEEITLVGNEPFWNIKIDGGTASYSTPENIDGSAFNVTRFAGNNGLGFSGDLDGETVQIAVTPGTCSDTMSDRDYPFTATVEIGSNTLNGCGYTDAQPFTGDEAP